MPSRLRRMVALGIVLALSCAACSDSETDPTTSAPADSVPTTAGTSADAAPDAATAATTTSAPAETTAAPAAPLSGVRLVEGMDRVDVLGPPHEGAGDAPMFEWEPVAGAAAYDLVVLGPEGPIWAWRGPETEVWLGGLPFERPPGFWGPVITDGSCWSVVALDDADHAIAVSDFLAVSPGEASGHQCLPGSGS